MPEAEEVRELLEAHNWDTARKQLIAVGKKIEKVHNLNVSSTLAIEIADLAIAKTVTGIRVWDPDRTNLGYFLREAVRSLYSNEIRKLANNPPMTHLDDPDHVEEAMLDHTPSAQEAVEIESELRVILRMLREHFPDQLSFMIEYETAGAFDAEKTDREIAEIMGISAPTLSKKKQKLLQALDSLSSDLNSGVPQTRRDGRGEL